MFVRIVRSNCRWGWTNREQCRRCGVAALAARTVLPLPRYPVWWINISQSELCKQASVLHIWHVPITTHFEFVPTDLLHSSSSSSREGEKENGGGILTLSTYNPHPPYFPLYPQHKSRYYKSVYYDCTTRQIIIIFCSEERDDRSLQEGRFWKGVGRFWRRV